MAVYLYELWSKASITFYATFLWSILISKSLHNIHAISNYKGNGHQYYLNCYVFLCCASVGMLSATEDLCYGLAGAGNNSATQPPLPRPGCRGESKETGRKLVGRDKGSLTEQQTKGTGTTMIQKRGIHKTNPQNRACRTEPLSPRMPLRAPELRVSSRHPAPPHRYPAWWHMVWNTLLCLVRLGQPARLCPFLDSSEN